MLGTCAISSICPSTAIRNSGSGERAEASAPSAAALFITVPLTGEDTPTLVPSGRVKRASSWPEVTLSPSPAMILVTRNPSASGRTMASAFGIRMPLTRTARLKQAGWALVTIAITRALPAALGGSAARAGATPAATAAAMTSRATAHILNATPLQWNRSLVRSSLRKCIRCREPLPASPRNPAVIGKYMRMIGPRDQTFPGACDLCTATPN